MNLVRRLPPLPTISDILRMYGIKAKKKFIQNQSGDVFSTWSDIKLANSLFRFSPQTKIEDGIKNFITWFKHYYKL